MTVLTRAGIPLGVWEGRCVLSFRRSAWFSDGKDPMVGLLSHGLGPSPGGMELDGSCPAVKPGTILQSDGQHWILEGRGELEGALVAPDVTARVSPESSSIHESPSWRQAWEQWFERSLPRDEEGVWLSRLVRGPGPDWLWLIGRGSGSTPLGDDFVGGWMAARIGRSLWTPEDRNRLRASLAGTARLSRHYLWHLAEGRADAAVAEFVRNRPQPDSACARSLALRGDRSGLATLVGLVAGLTTGV